MISWFDSRCSARMPVLYIYPYSTHYSAFQLSGQLFRFVLKTWVWAKKQTNSRWKIEFSPPDFETLHSIIFTNGCFRTAKGNSESSIYHHNWQLNPPCNKQPVYALALIIICCYHWSPSSIRWCLDRRRHSDSKQAREGMSVSHHRWNVRHLTSKRQYECNRH